MDNSTIILAIQNEIVDLLSDLYFDDIQTKHELEHKLESIYKNTLKLQKINKLNKN